MKLGVQILAYNVSRFIGPVIENAGPHVDWIYIAYSPRAWGYNADRRDAANRTTREELLATSFAHKTVVIDGDWPTEDGARNACLDRAREDGCDYVLVQDADEFYPPESWELNKAALAKAAGHEVFKTPWHNFWKTPEYVVEYEDRTTVAYNATFAVPCDGKARFIRKRITNAPEVGVLPGICYHYGYVLTDEEMLEKISTWGHTAEMFNLQSWYRYKWLGWSPATKNLHVVYPPEWSRAVKFDRPRPYFGDTVELSGGHRSTDASSSLGNRLYDAGVKLRVFARQLKRKFLGATPDPSRN